MNRRARTNRFGFTLIEILVVAMVIAILVTMLLPVLGKYRKIVKTKITQTTINQLDGACNRYQIDFKAFPPSNSAGNNTAPTNWPGAQLLPLYLIGYAGNPAGDGYPHGLLSQDDGVDGPGFRLTKGITYGPYGGAQNLPVAGNNPRWFTDAFDQPILYYRSDDPLVGGFHYGHNNTAASGDIPAFKGPGPDAALNQYAQGGGGVSNGPYLRKDFLLMSPGADGDFADPSKIVIGASDDVTNLYPHSP